MTRIRHAAGPIRPYPRQPHRRLRPRAVDCASTYGRDAFGQVVIARDFGEALEHRLTELKQLTSTPARCIAVTPVTDGMRGARSPTPMANSSHARLIVGADGTQSTVRELLHIDTTQHDYFQTLFRRTGCKPLKHPTEPLTNVSPNTAPRPCCLAPTVTMAPFIASPVPRPIQSLPWMTAPG